MGITLGNVTFDPAHTTVREKYAEVGGRDARRIVISGLVVGEGSMDGIESALDAIMTAASEDGVETELSLRSGRRLWVQRGSFSREVSKDGRVGSFVLELDARDPFEESTTSGSVLWSVTASGDAKSISNGGNAFSAPMITLVADGDVVRPAFSDGVRKVTYLGIVRNGETLVFNGCTGVVTLEGEDVTPYTEGVFPRIAAEGSELTYTDDVASSHRASVTVTTRDRWW